MGYTLAVTGAAGFIGRALCKRLRDNQQVTSVRGLTTRAVQAELLRDCSIDMVVGDIRDFAVLKRLVENRDVVVHAAAKLGKGDWPQFTSINVDAVRNITLASVQAGVKRIILVSTIEVYGFIHREVDETVAPQPCGHPYADSKVLGERAFWSGLQNSNTEGVVARPGMVFGPESEFWTLRLISLAQQGRLEVYGRGDGHAMPIYIDDLIDGLLLCIAKEEAADRTFNFANVEVVTWHRWYSDYCAMVSQDHVKSRSILAARLREAARVVLGKPPSRHFEIMTRTGSISSALAKQVLGWEPVVGYEGGMNRTQKWLRAKAAMERVSC